MALARMLRRWFLLGLITLVMLEVALQVLAIGVWLFYPDAEGDVEATDRVAICIGDSFTYGMGARAEDGPYPAQLQRILRQRCDDGFRVVNLGKPGRNSRQVLARLDAEIDRLQPELVCVIVGVNDTWSKPEELQLSDQPGAVEDEGFRLELRTLRLLSTFRSLFPYADQVGAVPDARVVGRWRSEEAGTVEFRADGSGSYRGQGVFWSVDGDHLIVWLEDGAPQFVAGIEVAEEGRVLDLHVEVAPAPIRLRRASADAGAFDAEWLLDEAQSALAREDFEQAIARATALVEGTSDEPMVQAGGLSILVIAHAAMGEDELKDEALRSLLSVRGRQLSPAVTSALIRALRALHQDDQALEVASEDIELFASDATLWQELAHLQLSLGQTEAARESIERSVAALDDDSEAWQVWLVRFHVYRELDIDEAARSLIRAAALGLSERSTRQWFTVLSRVLGAERLRELLEQGELDAATRRRVEVILGGVESAATGSDSTAAVFESHLRQIVDRCRGVGAQVVFASYPWGGSAWYYEVAAEVAAAEGVGWVEVYPAFDRRQREHPDAELFAADGHCNDAGYRLMAEVIAEHALRLLDDDQR